MKEKKVPMRMCLGCREMKPKKTLLRIVHGPDGSVTADPTGRKPGRGAYVCPERECILRALKQKQFERAFECALSDEARSALSSLAERSGDKA